MMPPLLRKILLADLFEGLRVTFRSQNPDKIYTEQYPAERPDVAPRYRAAAAEGRKRQDHLQCVRGLRAGMSRATDRGGQHSQPGNQKEGADYLYV